MLKSLKIKNYKLFKNFEISFVDSGNNPLNLIVLAGINGSGKTTILEYIANNFDSVVYLKAKEQNSQNLQKEIVRYIKFLIFKKGLSGKEAYKIISKKIESIFEGFDFEIKFSGLDEDENIYFENALGKEIAIESLSTGEKELLEKVFYLFVADIQDSIVLIDEPEISLHPSWQNRIVKIYKNLATQNNNQIIIATHSPHIVASTPNESLRVLVKEEHTIKVVSADAYGMQVNKALTDIMGVEELRDIEVQWLYDRVKQMILNNEYQSDDFKKDFLKLEEIMSNDRVNFGLLKLELLKRESKDASSN
jgi:predicted ATP-binding protein involved in virulence